MEQLEGEDMSRARSEQKSPKTNTFFRTVNSSSRNYKMKRFQDRSQGMNLGLGVVYSFEWQFSHDFQYNKEPQSGNWNTFVYVGITNQKTIGKRWTDHAGGSKTIENGKLLYIAANAALYNELSPYNKYKISSFNELVEVVTVVSLFDLAGYEKAAIKKNNLYQSALNTSTDFKSLIDNAKIENVSDKIIGLNDSPGGEGGPTALSRPPLEWLFAAFFACIEDTSDELISNGRALTNTNIHGSSLKEKMTNLLYDNILKGGTNVSNLVRNSFNSLKIKNIADLSLIVDVFLQFLDPKRNIKFEFDNKAGQPSYVDMLSNKSNYLTQETTLNEIFIGVNDKFIDITSTTERSVQAPRVLQEITKAIKNGKDVNFSFLLKSENTITSLSKKDVVELIPQINVKIKELMKDIVINNVDLTVKERIEYFEKKLSIKLKVPVLLSTRMKKHKETAVSDLIKALGILEIVNETSVKRTGVPIESSKQGNIINWIKEQIGIAGKITTS